MRLSAFVIWGAGMPDWMEMAAPGDTPTNPPMPAGLRLLQNSEVTPAITDWAVDVLNDSEQPMFSLSSVPQPGLGPCVAHVEWHPPEPSIDYWHRGVTIYAIVGSISLSDFVSFEGG